jgi:hypothetical protein
MLYNDNEAIHSDSDLFLESPIPAQQDNKCIVKHHHRIETPNKKERGIMMDFSSEKTLKLL